MKTKLQEIRDYLADPKRWTQTYTARDEQGLPVPSTEPSAVCCCLIGMVLRVSAGDNEARADITLKLTTSIPLDFVNRTELHRIAAYNDDPATSHDDILALLDRAIASTP